MTICISLAIYWSDDRVQCQQEKWTLSILLLWPLNWWMPCVQRENMRRIFNSINVVAESMQCPLIWSFDQEQKQRRIKTRRWWIAGVLVWHRLMISEWKLHVINELGKFQSISLLDRALVGSTTVSLWWNPFDYLKRRRRRIPRSIEWRERWDKERERENYQGMDYSFTSSIVMRMIWRSATDRLFEWSSSSFRNRERERGSLHLSNKRKQMTMSSSFAIWKKNFPNQISFFSMADEKDKNEERKSICFLFFFERTTFSLDDHRWTCVPMVREEKETSHFQSSNRCDVGLK